MKTSNQSREDTHYILIIHGTWNAPEKSEPRKEPPKWYELNPTDDFNFCTRLTKMLSGTELEKAIWRPVEGIKWPFAWTGENSNKARLEGAKKLYQTITRIVAEDPYARIHIIAHSHGGHVLLNATERYLRLLEAQADAISAQRIDKLFGQIELVGARPALNSLFGEGYDIAIGRASESMGELDGELKNLGKQKISQREYANATARYGKPIGADGWSDIGSLSRPHNLIVGRKTEACRNRFIKNWITSPESNRLGNLVFLGTPFYHKDWDKIETGWPRRLGYATIYAAVSLIITYVAFMVSLNVVHNFFSLPFSYWNPMQWPFYINALMVLVGMIFSIPALLSEGAYDTNVYFDNSPHRCWSGYRPFLRALIVHAGVLDEAFLALTSRPIFFPYLLPMIEALVAQFARLSGADRSDKVGVSEHIDKRFTLLRPILFLMRITVNMLAWPVRKMLTRYLTRALPTLASAVSLGLSPVEFAGANVVVRNNIGVPSVFDEGSGKNVTKEILECGPLVEQGSRELDSQSSTSQETPYARYAFLWDPELTLERLERSKLWEKIGDSALKHLHDDDYGDTSSLRDEERELQEKTLAIEERLKELSGAVELNHSTYYTNETVIEMVADFLKNNCSEA